MDVQEVNQYYITYFVGRGAPGGSVRSSLPGFQDSTHDEITRTTLSHTISETLSSSGATSVSNLKSNANIVYGAVGSISNYNPVINNIVYGDVPKNSDTIQAKIASILNSRHVAQAVYGAQIEKGCMKDTRVQVLRDIEAWIKDFKGPQILWLVGMAGTGKSAIAWSICSRANSNLEIIFGGSFFCSRWTGVSAQRDVRCVVPTLARLMARQSVKFAEALAAELALDPEVLHQQVGVQVEKLLYNPLLALKDSLMPIVFVIDALDECGGQLDHDGALDHEAHRIVSDMLEALVTFSESVVKLPVKFLLTSRPETHIRDTHVSNDAFSKVLRLHTVDKQQIAADIRLYISNRLSATPTLQRLFTEGDVTTLVELSNGLFIVAATALGYTLGAGVDLAKARFNSLLNASRDHLSAGASEPLDRMYAAIVEDAAMVGEKLEMLLRILAALLSARMMLSVAALADLLDIPIGQLRASISRLHAAIHVPDDDDDASLRPIHASFGGYLFGRAAPPIRLSEALGHDILAHGCLQVLAKRLYFNISQSRSSFEPNSTSKPSSITVSLEYASLQWIYHVSTLLEISRNDLSSGNTLRSRFPPWMQLAPRGLHQSALEEKISAVFRPRLLFWLEIMSILGQVQRAAAMLLFAAETVQKKELSRFFSDANSFVATSQEAIEQSAPHIYISALPFALKDSLVYQEYFPLCSGLISVDPIGVSHHAGRLLVTLAGHEGTVNSVSYSPHGHLLASVSADGTTRIWDMRTGEEIMTPLRCDNDAVCSVSISPDGKSVASGTEGGIVGIWSLADAHIDVQRLSGHSAAVSSVQYSPSGFYLASASMDNTVCLWSIETYKQVVTLRGHIDKVHALAFSPDSLTLATGSEDCTIRLWDVATGEPRYNSLHHHERPIYCLHFLPDGQKIAAGSGNDIILCKPQTGRNTGLVHSGSDRVLSLNASPDGLSLVSTYGRSVCLSTLPRFRGKTTSLVLDGHTQTVRAAAYSSNGVYVASASDDSTIRVWNASSEWPVTAHEVTDTDAATAIVRGSRTLDGHKYYVTSVAVSPDGTCIVSGSDDKSIRIWDVRKGPESLPPWPPLLGHTGSVLSVAISSDGRLIASGSKDMTVRLWDLQTSKAVGQLMQGHSSIVNAVVFSNDTRWLISGSQDKTLRIWDVATQRSSEVGPLSCNNSVLTVALSPDGRLIAAGDSSGYIEFWHSETGRPTGKPLRTLLDQVWSIGFSPDGARIVSGGSHSTKHVRIWNVSTGELVFALAGHVDLVRSVAYSSDGRMIVTGSYDGTVRLWDALTGVSLELLSGHNDRILSVAVTPDGHSVVSASTKSAIRVWDRSRAAMTCPVSDGNAVAVLDVVISDNGWLQGPSGELLLWVPTKYHKYLYGLRGSPRVVISIGESGWHRGESWTACWGVDHSSRVL